MYLAQTNVSYSPPQRTVSQSAVNFSGRHDVNRLEGEIKSKLSVIKEKLLQNSASAVSTVFFSESGGQTISLEKDTSGRQFIYNLAVKDIAINNNEKIDVTPINYSFNQHLEFLNAPDFKQILNGQSLTDEVVQNIRLQQLHYFLKKIIDKIDTPKATYTKTN